MTQRHPLPQSRLRPSLLTRAARAALATSTLSIGAFGVAQAQTTPSPAAGSTVEVTGFRASC